MAIEIFIDGSYRNVSGTGSYGLVLKEKGKEDFSVIRKENNTTNNIMELKGLLLAFTLIREAQLTEKVTIFCDSQYVVNGFNLWYDNWLSRGWKTAGNKEVKNKEIWLEIKSASLGLNFDLRWSRGTQTTRAIKKSMRLCNRLLIKNPLNWGFFILTISLIYLGQNIM